MNKDELKDQFSTECTEINKKGITVVKGTPMDIIDWIANKFHLQETINPTECINKNSGQKICFEVNKCEKCKQ